MPGSKRGGARRMGRSSRVRRSRPSNKRSSRTGFVANSTLKNAATTSIRGSAAHDLISSIPLMGRKFENRRMVYYDEDMELAESSGILRTHFFRANDAYDPDAATGGHQPIGFDQAMSLFEHFVVFSSKITVSFISNSPAAIRVGVFLSPDAVAPATNGDLMENGYLRSTLLYGASTSTFGGASNTVKTVSLTCDNPKYFGQRGRLGYQTNPVFSGTAASSPSEMNYFGIFAFCMTGAVSYSVVYDVQLSYDVYFYEPRKISQSLAAEVLRTSIERDQVSLQPSHEEKVLEVARRVRAKKDSTVKDFVSEMKTQGLWQDQKTYRERRDKAYMKVRFLSTKRPERVEEGEEVKDEDRENLYYTLPSRFSVGPSGPIPCKEEEPYERPPATAPLNPEDPEQFSEFIRQWNSSLKGVGTTVETEERPQGLSHSES